MQLRKRSALFAVTLSFWSSASAAQEVGVGLFGDVALRLTDEPQAAAVLGQTDLYVTASALDAWSALTEVVLELDEENQLVVDLERIQLRFRPSDLFQLTAGRFHQTLGTFNTTYHHGSFLQTAIERPKVVGFEDEGGLLPVHLVGVEAAGRVGVGDDLALHYAAAIGNGRGKIADEVAAAIDRDLGKSLSSQLALEVIPIDLRFGALLLVDSIPENTDPGPLAHGALIETIAGAHVVWRGAGVHVLSEAYLIQHRAETGEPAVSGGGFLEVSSDLRWLFADAEWVRPYARVEGLVFPDLPEPFFSPQATLPDEVLAQVGARVALGTHVAVKGEYALSVPTPGTPSHAATLQLAFGY